MLWGGLIAAPILLPLMEFTSLSTRNMMSPEDNLFLSLPLSYLSGLLIPDIAGFAEWLLYPGIFSLLSLVIILNGKVMEGESIFWIIVALMALLVALGNSLPLPKTPDLTGGFWVIAGTSESATFAWVRIFSFQCNWLFHSVQ